MKAYEVQQFGIDNLAEVEREMPEPGAHEVVVRIRATALNHRDLMVISGTYNPRMRLPAVPLSDGAGEVVAVGKDVTRWRIGDQVIPIFAQQWIDGESTDEKRRTALGAGAQWDGTLREFAAFNEHGLVAKPEYLSFAEAATLPCTAVTAWNALVVSGGLKAGDTVLTLGSGGVSVFAIQIAKMLGAQVISTSGSDEKLQRLKEIGADDLINYRENEDWERRALELTGKRGVDHVVEVGGAGTLQRSVASVRVGGHVAMIGAVAGAGNFDPVSAFMKSVRLQGIFVGSRVMLEDAIRAFSVNMVRPVVDSEFGFEDARAALKYMGSGAHVGKVVIKGS